MATGKSILSSLRSELDLGDYRKLHWEGTFEDYLNIVLERPDVTRTAYQRLYDMILLHGTEEVYENKGHVRCKYYDDLLKKFIKLTLPADSLMPIRKAPKLKVLVSSKPRQQ